jgi:uncharacterized RDD family membrane protein YckC
VLVLLVGGGLYAGGDVSATEAILAVLGTIAVFAFVVLLYAPLLMARTNGQTVGRMVAGCRVVRTDGKPVGFAYAAVREVAVKGLLLGIAGAATGGIAYVVDGVWPLVDPENRALHDYLVDSRVVKTGG